jgi:hypothetical protein
MPIWGLQKHWGTSKAGEASEASQEEKFCSLRESQELKSPAENSNLLKFRCFSLLSNGAWDLL